MESTIVVMKPAELTAIVSDAVRQAVAIAIAGTGVREVMTEVEAADYLRNGKSTLRQWRCQGIGPAYIKDSKTVRYRRQDLDIWLANNKIRTRS